MIKFTENVLYRKFKYSNFYFLSFTIPRIENQIPSKKHSLKISRHIPNRPEPLKQWSYYRMYAFRFWYKTLCQKEVITQA